VYELYHVLDDDDPAYAGFKKCSNRFRSARKVGRRATLR
jgi:hypothetical protein